MLVEYCLHLVYFSCLHVTFLLPWSTSYPVSLLEDDTHTSGTYLATGIIVLASSLSQVRRTRTSYNNVTLFLETCWVIVMQLKCWSWCSACPVWKEWFWALWIVLHKNKLNFINLIVFFTVNMFLFGVWLFFFYSVIYLIRKLFFILVAVLHSLLYYCNSVLHHFPSYCNRDLPVLFFQIFFVYFWHMFVLRESISSSPSNI